MLCMKASQAIPHSRGLLQSVFLRSLSSSSSAPPPLGVLLPLHGLIPVLKPLNWTSADVVRKVKGLLEEEQSRRLAAARTGVLPPPLPPRFGPHPKDGASRPRGARGGVVKIPKPPKPQEVKVGHGGTLDPLASGVLVLGIGSGTKSLQPYLSGPKEYFASALLGQQSETLDLEGDIVAMRSYDHVTFDMLRKVVGESFKGRIMQIPPIHSALKIDGEKMYDLARRGESAKDLDIPPREVMIYDIEVMEADGAGKVGLPEFGLRVSCGGGTYVRSLVRDIGLQCDTVATLSGLVRTRQGPFTHDLCLREEDWTAEKLYNKMLVTNKMLGFRNIST